jgi:MIP family channel proteins
MRGLFSTQRDLLAELLGTFFLVLIGTSVVTAIGVSGEATSAAVILVSAFAFGLTLAVWITCFSAPHIAHLNPAVSLGAALYGKLSWAKLPIYVLCQAAGAMLASILVAILYGTAGVEADLGSPRSVTELGPIAGIGAEALGTALLVGVVLRIAYHPTMTRWRQGTVIGLSLGLGIMFAGGISGGALNPARALAPQLVAADIRDWWVYVIGPFLGATIATILVLLVRDSSIPVPDQETKIIADTPAEAVAQAAAESSPQPSIQFQAEQAIERLREHAGPIKRPEASPPPTLSTAPVAAPSFTSAAAPAPPTLASDGLPQPASSSVRFVNFDRQPEETQ